ncbi:MAG: pyruvate ferredoxin oxidoreductase [Nitrososphaerota archaeon]|jgi:pyruvate ferredoxin oxidoreductase alpha subunit|uniref:transketolase C-terminal domain-containing protein n=1 Tax=Candidatus Bathycorpusculum sp. TaxID=2994959 RepID=UPI002834ABA0|nr:pyruvate ferredoxin oxidoreductase [Candidatus Termitimicrobium sp.]MCL2432494.1 pyruvate ferredoxin oxidoreductase [Candidatus Termitimicrobium sp.]MDR0493945.1 pyruvate ferredoxin oxidoreductase [Nitrososphaerota archaeon]
MNGDEAIAYAVKQCDVDVVAAYPITPQTIIVEKFSEYVANGEVQTEYVCTESEHSAITACLAAGAVGARTFTASASAGLALMHEMLFVTSGARVPVVLAVANRALSAPINIHGDQSDSMAERDSGWIHIYAENAQEAYDSIIQAFKIAEDVNVSLPIFIGVDGFTISHTLERVDTLTDADVREFVGERHYPTVLTHEGKTVPFKLDPANPLTMGPIALQNYYYEFKRQQEEAMKNAYKKIQEINNEYAKLSGRNYGNGLIDTYKLDDAEIAIVVIGSTAGTLKDIVDQLRTKNIKAGILRIRTFRPFPAEELKNALLNVKAIAVMDKSMSPGGLGAALFNEVRNALYDAKQRPIVVNYIFGLGGRDSSPSELHKIYDDLYRIAQSGQPEKTVTYFGLRE